MEPVFTIIHIAAAYKTTSAAKNFTERTIYRIIISYSVCLPAAVAQVRAARRRFRVRTQPAKPASSDAGLRPPKAAACASLKRRSSSPEIIGKNSSSATAGVALKARAAEDVAIFDCGLCRQYHRPKSPTIFFVSNCNSQNCASRSFAARRLAKNKLAVRKLRSQNFIRLKFLSDKFFNLNIRPKSPRTFIFCGSAESRPPQLQKMRKPKACELFRQHHLPQPSPPLRQSFG